VWVAVPAVSDALGAFGAYLARYGASGIAETQSLFAGGLGSVAAPVLLFGFVFFIGLPYALWAGYATLVGDGRPALLVVTAYALTFTLLSVVQVRFAGQLALTIAPFAGIGFIHLADRTEILEAPALFAREPTAAPRGDGGASTLSLPSGRTLGALVVLFLLVGGLGAIQTPIKMDQVAIDDDTAAAGTWVAGHASADAKATTPYVLTEWGRSRTLNFLAGGAYTTYEDYGYALDTYGPFVTARSPDGWYDRLAEAGVDYVVVSRETTAELPADTVGARLSQQYGSAGDAAGGLSHYRALYTAGDQVVFEVVPGARLTGAAAPNATVTVETTVEVGGQPVTYTRTAATDASGAYAVTVPYPGTYAVDGTTVDVSEAAVANGATVTVNS
jgi:dolichyl-diphosphooligosaccharide--protein glycosyltransferase